MNKLAINISNILVALTVIGAVISYTLPINYIGHILMIISLIILSATSNYKKKIDNKSVFYFIIIYMIFSITSVIYNFRFQQFDLIITLLYPIVFTLIYINWKRLLTLTPFYLYLISFIFIANGFFAAIEVFGLKLNPFTDENVNRYIFFTDYRSSSGLMWNVNYYAVVQGASFWYIALLANNINYKSKILDIILFFIAISIIFGSSRGASAAFLSSLFIYISIKLPNPTIKILSFSAVFLIIVYIVDFYQIDNDIIFGNFRLERGLNNRGDIWISSIFLLKENYIFGFGSPSAISKMLTDAGSPNTAIQNAYLLTALRIGFIPAIFSLLLIVIAIIKSIKKSLKFDFNLISLCGLLFIFIDSFFRSYSLGGAGVIPLLMVVFLGACFSSAGFTSTSRRTRSITKERLNEQAYLYKNR